MNAADPNSAAPGTRGPIGLTDPAAPLGRARPLREALRIPGQAARLLPTVPSVNADCRALTAAYAVAVAPLLPGGACGSFARRLLPWAVKGGVLVLRYTRLIGRPTDCPLAVLAGAFTRLYDDALDECTSMPDSAPLHLLMTAPATATGPTAFAAPATGSGCVPGATQDAAAAALFLALRARTDPTRHRAAYAALPRLHAAQLVSQAASRTASDGDLVRASRVKGGLGMLVLGGLVQPEPEPAQQDALLALGGFLQLVDDYEDRAADLRAGVATAATRGALPLGELYAELARVEARLAPLYGPYRTRCFTDGLACWLNLTALTRLLRGGRPPPARGPVRAGPPTVSALFTLREVIR